MNCLSCCVKGVLDKPSGVVGDTGVLDIASGFFVDMAVLDTATEVLDMVIGKVTGGDSSIARKNNAPSSSDASSTVMALVLPGSGAELQVEAKWLGLSHLDKFTQMLYKTFIWLVGCHHHVFFVHSECSSSSAACKRFGGHWQLMVRRLAWV